MATIARETERLRRTAQARTAPNFLRAHRALGPAPHQGPLPWGFTAAGRGSGCSTGTSCCLRGVASVRAFEYFSLLTRVICLKTKIASHRRKEQRFSTLPLFGDAICVAFHILFPSIGSGVVKKGTRCIDHARGETCGGDGAGRGGGGAVGPCCEHAAPAAPQESAPGQREMPCHRGGDADTTQHTAHHSQSKGQ